VHIQIQRRAETLHQCDCAGRAGGTTEAGLADQVARDRPIHLDHFTLAVDGGKGSDVSLAAGPGAIVAGVAPSVLDFVSDFHRGLTDGRIMPLHGLQPSLLFTTSGAAQDVNGYGIALHAIVDHSLAHAALGLCKA
jgi:hypothetical protein